MTNPLEKYYIQDSKALNYLENFASDKSSGSCIWGSSPIDDKTHQLARKAQDHPYWNTVCIVKEIFETTILSGLFASSVIILKNLDEIRFHNLGPLREACNSLFCEVNETCVANCTCGELETLMYSAGSYIHSVISAHPYATAAGTVAVASLAMFNAMGEYQESRQRAQDELYNDLRDKFFEAAMNLSDNYEEAQKQGKYVEDFKSLAQRILGNKARIRQELKDLKALSDKHIKQIARPVFKKARMIVKSTEITRDGERG